MNNTPIAHAESASELIDARIQSLPDWRGNLLSSLRGLIRAADSAMIEEWKWSTPAWSSHGLVCTGETYKQVVSVKCGRSHFVSELGTPGSVRGLLSNGHPYRNPRPTMDIPPSSETDIRISAPRT